jgi:hypothetical protein
MATLVCSLNSHIPKVHNLSRGLPEDDPNCDLIMSLPKKLDNTTVAISAVPDSFNVDHLKEFTLATYEKGFKSIAFCFVRDLINPKDKDKMIGFYLWLSSLKGELKDFVFNTPENIKGVIHWYLNRTVPKHLVCQAPKKTIYVTADRKMFPCWGLFRGSNLDCAYHVGDIGNQNSTYNQLARSSYGYCHDDCLLSSCYI